MLVKEDRELRPYLDKQGILHELKVQIEKDLRTFGLECNWIEVDEESAENILKTLTFVMAFLLEKDRQRLMQFIYRVDIQEDLLGRVLEEESNEGLDERIANLVMKRELQKVILRHKYSGA